MCRSRPQPVQQLSAFFAGVLASRAPDSASLSNLTWIAAIVSQRDGWSRPAGLSRASPLAVKHDYSSVWGAASGGDVGYWLARAIADRDDPFCNCRHSLARLCAVRPVSVEGPEKSEQGLAGRGALVLGHRGACSGRRGDGAHADYRSDRAVVSFSLQTLRHAPLASSIDPNTP